MALGTTPWGLTLIDYYLQLRGQDAAVVKKDTELVIEGPPRCGNTTAVSAFRIAQGRPVIVAHHVHGPAQIIVAARLSVPCLVLLRDPLQAAISLHQRERRISVSYALRNICQFMQCIEPYRSSFLPVTLDRMLSDFDSVISDINLHFGTRYKGLGEPLCKSKRVRDAVESMDARDQGGTVNENTLGWPSVHRQKIAAALYEECRRDMEIMNLHQTACEMMESLLAG